MTTSTVIDLVKRLNRDDRPKRRPYCTCGNSFHQYERLYDGRCEICHEHDATPPFEEWDTIKKVYHA